MAEEKHCLNCGDTHSGECSPNSFVYYQCSECDRSQMMPWDALAFGGGLSNCYCGCGAEADKSWQRIDHEKYLEVVKNGN